MTASSDTGTQTLKTCQDQITPTTLLTLHLITIETLLWVTQVSSQPDPLIKVPVIVQRLKAGIHDVMFVRVAKLAVGGNGHLRVLVRRRSARPK